MYGSGAYGLVIERREIQESTAAMTPQIERSGTAAEAITKSGIPQWNGDARTFQEYEETALLWN